MDDKFLVTDAVVSMCYSQSSVIDQTDALLVELEGDIVKTLMKSMSNISLLNSFIYSNLLHYLGGMAVPLAYAQVHKQIYTLRLYS